MTNPDTMTISECCDALSEFAGYRHVEYGDTLYAEHGCRNPHRLVWINDCNGICDDHPIPPTLDSIAGALPEGWRWHRIEWVNHERCGCRCESGYQTTCRENTSVPSWRDKEATARHKYMIEAMARAAVKAWQVVRGELCSPA